MNRDYTITTFNRMCRTISKKVPRMTLATDIICGYPGETDDDHAETIKLLEDFRFAVVNISQFYPRPGTKAAGERGVNSGVKKKRSGEVTEKFMRYISWEGRRECTANIFFAIGHGGLYPRGSRSCSI